ncbi:hypothetical protein QBC42DRAFT_255519 [Cladorrhinum samala]|uniref:Uncharacterized protein n=1 Tax=Cladorrhinum samala TaxID=585594 RepID=A0AAV9HE60_9PEZI|nr:hypothetical protein QBC42DRAFT_255519 [Cladorrhinum samala]
MSLLTAPQAVTATTTTTTTTPTKPPLYSSPSSASLKKQNQFPPSSSEITSTIYPLIHNALRFQKLVLAAALQLIMQTLSAAHLVGTSCILYSRAIAWRGLEVAWMLWDSKRARRFRKRIEFEFFVLLLGPLGNMMFLGLFWFGWVLLGLGIWGWFTG